jgi:hypothetical protein
LKLFEFLLCLRVQRPQLLEGVLRFGSLLLLIFESSSESFYFVDVSFEFGFEGRSVSR